MRTTTEWRPYPRRRKAWAALSLALLTAFVLGGCGPEPEPPEITATPTSGVLVLTAMSTITVCASNREALVAIYDATNGAKWFRNNGWLSDAPIGQWFGVTADDDCNVTRLILPSNRLLGELPPELGGLPLLTHLDLSRNYLLGSIPVELGDLVNLQTIRLSSNELTGGIPSQLGKLANLESLSLHWNQLSGEIPQQLGNLANLELLDLGGNQLSGDVPPQLGNLAKLTDLDLSFNQLSGCVPSGLQDRLNLRLSSLGELPFCPE